MHEALKFIYAQETGSLNPTNCQRIEQDLLTKPLRCPGQESIRKTNSSFALLEMCEKMPIFIPVDFMKDAVELVVRKLSGGYVPGGT